MRAHEPEKLIEEFIAAFNAGDLDGLVRDLYEEDVVVVPGPGPEMMSGRDAVVRGLQPVLATGGKMSLASVVAIRNGDLALTHTKVRFALPGQEPMDVRWVRSRPAHAPTCGIAGVVRSEREGPLGWRVILMPGRWGSGSR